jgi:hypothetical protein
MNLRYFVKTNLIGAIVGTLMTAAALAADQVDLSLITDKGWVQFTVGGNWKVLTMDTKNPARVALFQLPNPADEGTPDSTNAAVMLYELDSKMASARYAKVRERYRNGARSRIGVWETFKSEVKERNTSYSGRVAYRDIADVHVCVTLAWPHLQKNAAGYDAEMEQTFLGILKSVNGALGKFPKEKGGVLRRPL